MNQLKRIFHDEDICFILVEHVFHVSEQLMKPNCNCLVAVDNLLLQPAIETPSRSASASHQNTLTRIHSQSKTGTETGFKDILKYGTLIHELCLALCIHAQKNTGQSGVNKRNTVQDPHAISSIDAPL